MCIEFKTIFRLSLSIKLSSIFKASKQSFIVAVYVVNVKSPVIHLSLENESSVVFLILMYLSFFKEMAFWVFDVDGLLFLALVFVVASAVF